jgi:dihydroflavonol-4-reductase
MVRNVLITGANGFIGSQLVGRMVGPLPFVRTLIRKSPISPCKGANTAILVGDIRDRAAVVRAVDGVDAIFHLAAEKRDQALMYETNVQGTGNLLDAAVKSGVQRFVYCSTCSVYGPPKEEIVTEESACYPVGDYAKSKLMAEELVHDYAARGLNTLVIRPTWVFGECDPRHTFLDLFRYARRGVLPLFGKGDGIMNFIYVGDFVDVFLDLAQDPSTSGQTFIVSDYCQTSEAVDLVSGLVGRRPRSVRVPNAMRKPLARIPQCFLRMGFNSLIELSNSRLFSTDRISGRTSYAERVAIVEGMRRMLVHYTESGLF